MAGSHGLAKSARYAESRYETAMQPPESRDRRLLANLIGVELGEWRAHEQSAWLGVWQYSPL